MTEIAIITPNLNNGRFIRQNVESTIAAAANWNGSNSESVRLHFFITDSGSTDGSRDNIQILVNEKTSDAVRFTPTYYDHNRGQNAVINEMIEAAAKSQCKYAVVLDADDRLMSNFFRQTLPSLPLKHTTAASGLGYVYTDLNFVDEKLHPIAPGIFEDFKRAATETGGYCIPTPALITLRCLKDGMPYDTKLSGQINQSRYKKLHERGWTGLHVPRICFQYRVHNNNVSGLRELVLDAAKTAPRRPLFVRDMWKHDVAGVS